MEQWMPAVSVLVSSQMSYECSPHRRQQGGHIKIILMVSITRGAGRQQLLLRPDAILPVTLVLAQTRLEGCQRVDTDSLPHLRKHPTLWLSVSAVRTQPHRPFSSYALPPSARLLHSPLYPLRSCLAAASRRNYFQLRQVWWYRPVIPATF